MKRLRCRGVAAIEAALVMAGLAPLLALALNMGHLAIDGAAADRAASNAARFLSQVPLESLRDSSRRTVVLDSAQQMIGQTLSAANIGPQAWHVEFMCDIGHCDQLLPGMVPSKIGVMLTVESQAVVELGHPAVNLVVYAEAGRDN
ncbi:hypothetical protein [Pseudoduganella sp. R-34]|uniref:hypothetical protein n=1 Tax=Pseudoduganella sp. R-34 TaxID=3404062 RepID=UPI003CE73354